MEAFTEAPAGGKTADEILKSKAKIERARLKRVAARGAAKPAKKAKKKPTFRQVTKKLAKAHPTKAKKVKRPKPAKSAACVRSERLDMRLTKAEKAKVHGRAKALRRTVTSIVIEAIEKIK